MYSTANVLEPAGRILVLDLPWRGNTWTGSNKGIRRDMSELARYPLSETLAQDEEFALSRRRSDSGQSLLVLSPVREPPTPASFERLEHEYALRADLDPAWAARPRALARLDGRMVLVLDDPGGEPLERRLGAPMELAPFLRLAIALCEALAQVHRHGLIHKDLQPAHVLVEAASGQVRLTGFGIASRLRREQQAPEAIAGTLAYMAPEQTGRMNRSVDARSDLYALGVILYRALTGVLPFTASDPMAWVHCHVAQQPTPPAERRPGIPAPVSALVMKLLAKTAEARYQTAAGVAADLRRCSEAWAAHRPIADFPLARHDLSDQLRIPEKLYGREREIRALIEAFERVVSRGTMELVLISGPSGIGKSSLANELHRAIVPARGLFGTGKFDPYRRHIPYATLAQAFQPLVRQLLVKSESELGAWREAIRQGLGPSGQVLVEFIPGLELVVGQQPSLPTLPPLEAVNRFHAVFRRFLAAFARPEHPLVLFLDDLQWLDTATLKLIEYLVVHADVRHLLLIGAWRDKEIGPAHPLASTLAAIRQTEARRQEIVLAPLSVDDLGLLLADALHRKLHRVEPLARLLHEKTAGNPFFAIHFLAMLHDEGLLAFDTRSGIWTWDLERIHAKAYTDNVVELMIAQLKCLPAATQEALKPLACLGSCADLATLSGVLGRSAPDTEADLWAAVGAGLLLSGAGYCFSHDRIREAAYALVAGEQRPALHLKIGRLLLSRLPPAAIAEPVFDVVNQLNAGASLISPGEERQRVAELNLLAARQAKASGNFRGAADFAAAGMEMLDDDAWERQYGLIYALSLEGVECAFLNGAFGEAERRFPALLQRARNSVDKAAVYRVMVDTHTTRGADDEAIESALACLRLFDIEISPHPSAAEVDEAYRNVWRNLGSRRIEELIDLPLMTDPNMQAAMEVLARLYAPAYHSDNNLFYLHLCHGVNISLRHGNSPAATHAYGWFGVILGAGFQRYPEGFRFAKLALDLVERHGFAAYRAKAIFVMRIISYWTQPLDRMLDYSRAAFSAAVDTGDVPVACFSCNHTVMGRLIRGDRLPEVHHEAVQALDFVGKAGFRDVHDMIVGIERLVQAMRGHTRELASYDDERFSEAAFEAELARKRMPTLTFYYYALKLMARFLAADHEAALAAGEKAHAVLWAGLFSAQGHCFHFYFALALAAVFDTLPAAKQKEALATIAGHQAELRQSAKHYPPTFHPPYALVGAEIARLRGQGEEAMRLYEESIRGARENGFVHNEGLANELAARFYRARGFDTIANAYLAAARSCYVLWGAKAKVGQLDASYPQLRARSALSGAILDADPEHLDLLAVVRASQALSGEIVPARLIATLMTIVLQNAGAERGLLIVPAGAAWRIEAEANTGREKVEVVLRQAPAVPADFPESILRYVERTREKVLLDDAAAPNLFSEDAYLCRRQPRSVCCLPLAKQAKLVGVLYLENRLAPHAFTPQRMAVLELLASQAAISLENARLYAELEERQARIRRLVESNIIGILFWDMAGNISEANEAFLAMVGYSREDLVSGKVRWPDMTPPEWRHLDDGAIEELKATGSCRPFEKEYLRKDGSRVPILLAGALLEGSPDQGVAFVLDLSERKRAEAERQAREAAEAANRAKSEFLANMSHELRSPLNTILGFARLVAREPALPEATREDLDLILKSGEHLQALINGVLDLSKLEAGQTTLDETDFDLDFLLDELKEIFTPAAAGKGLQLLFAPHPQVPRHIRSDPLKLRQVLINLIGNALKFTRQGGVTVQVEASAAEAGPASTRLAFTVSDSGPGIAPDELPNLFATFVQARAGRQAQEGSGLGLAISRRFVEIMGGDMRIASEPGRGATIRFEIPVQRVDAAAVSPIDTRRAVGLAPGQPCYRMLVVDDHREARQLLLRLLAPLGFELKEAGNGEEAIERWRDWQPDLIWMDLRMPVLDGREATRRIRSRAGKQQPVIVALTASTFEEEGADIPAPGYDDFLRKPFREADLFALVEKHLGVRFVYQEEAAPLPSPALDPAALAALPAALRAGLAEALVRLDAAAVDQAIAAIRARDAQLAGALAAWAGDFQYERILSSLTQADDRPGNGPRRRR